MGKRILKFRKIKIFRIWKNSQVGFGEDLLRKSLILTENDTQNSFDMPAYRNRARHQNRVQSQTGPAMRFSDQEIDCVRWTLPVFDEKTYFEISGNQDFQNLAKLPSRVW